MTPRKQGYMYMFLGRYQEAENCFRAYFSNLQKPNRGWWRASLIYVPRYRGKFRDGLRIADECIAANRLDDMDSTNWVMYAIKSDMYESLNQIDSALAAMKLACTLMDEQTRKSEGMGRDWLAILSFKVGDTATARLLLEQLEQDVQLTRTNSVVEYWHARGRIAILTKNYVQAIECMARVDSISYSYGRRYNLAKAYLESGDARRAIQILEKLLMKYDEGRALCGAAAVTGYYLLGRAYDEIGDRNRARRALETFLAVWKDADPGLKEVEDARMRLARLKAKS